MLSKSALKTVNEIEESIKECEKLVLNIALSYGGRDEILRACTKICIDAVNRNINFDDITEDVFSSYLDTKDIPDINLIIRTGGHHRLSNFFPWQTVYSEIYFLDIL